MKTKSQLSVLSFVVLSLWLAVSASLSSAQAQGTAFTYQGRLNAGTNPVTGLYDLTFAVYNASSGGSQDGPIVTNLAVAVTNGLFTVQVDFGAGVFAASDEWLQLGVRTNGTTVAFSALLPRNPVTPTPFAIYAETANAAGLSGTIPAGDLSGTYGGAVTLNNAGNSFTGNGAGLTGVNAADLGGFPATHFWQLGGNAGTTPSVNYLGTPDNQALEIHVDGARGFRVEPDPTYSTPNVIGGSAANYVGAGWVGNFIGAGGQNGFASNYITGGNLNVIGGGWINHITNGYENTIAGGYNNTAAGGVSSIGGGYNNTVTGYGATVPGGYNNLASGQYSFAAGQNAQAQNTGSFVWSDSTGGTFSDTGVNQFLIRANGGVGIGVTSAPQNYLSVHGGLNIDQANDNAGFLDNGNTNGFGLSFGSHSGEGIASQRQATGGNQYGLDFYTDFTTRMSITQSGFVGIGTDTPVNSGDTLFEIANPANTNTWDGMWVETGAGGLPFYGYSEGGGYNAYTWVDGTDANKWKLWNGSGTWLTVTTSGDVGIGTTTPGSALEVANGDIRPDGNRYLLYSGSDTNNGIGGGKLASGFGIDGGEGPCLFGYFGGELGATLPNIIALSWDSAGDIWVSNNASVGTLTIRGGADLAEPFNISAGQGEVSEGAVVVIDEQSPGHLKLSDSAYDVRVAGVVSGANGINPGIQMHQQGILEGGKNVALTGRVYVQADTSNGAIHPGDMLTTSSTPGHAMKVSDHARAAGAILGKAMTGLSEGKGMVLVLVTLQ